MGSHCTSGTTYARHRAERSSVTSLSPNIKSDTCTTRERACVPDVQHDKHHTGCARASATARHTPHGFTRCFTCYNETRCVRSNGVTSCSTPGSTSVLPFPSLVRPHSLRYMEDDVHPAVVDSGRALPRGAFCRAGYRGAIGWLLVWLRRWEVLLVVRGRRIVV